MDWFINMPIINNEKKKKIAESINDLKYIKFFNTTTNKLIWDTPYKISKKIPTRSIKNTLDIVAGHIACAF